MNQVMHLFVRCCLPWLTWAGLHDNLFLPLASDVVPWLAVELSDYDLLQGLDEHDAMELQLAESAAYMAQGPNP